MESVRNIMLRLAEPFDADEVKWKAQATAKDGSRAMAVAYVDARVIQDRLDAVVGIDNWQDWYEAMPDGSVMCRLSLRLAGEWIQKSDVGGASDQPDCGDRVKAAFSDALKRTAVKFGVGRYLYALPCQWVEYDAQKKQLKAKPQLPAWAVPDPLVAESRVRELAKLFEASGRNVEAAMEWLKLPRSTPLAELRMTQADKLEVQLKKSIKPDGGANHAA